MSLSKDEPFNGKVVVTIEQEEGRRRHLLGVWMTTIHVEITSEAMKIENNGQMPESNLLEKVSNLTESLTNDGESSIFLNIINEQARKENFEMFSTIDVAETPVQTLVTPTPTISPTISPTMKIKSPTVSWNTIFNSAIESTPTVVVLSICFLALT